MMNRALDTHQPAAETSVQRMAFATSAVAARGLVVANPVLGSGPGALVGRRVR